MSANQIQSDQPPTTPQAPAADAPPAAVVYSSIYDYMERTRTNVSKLAKLTRIKRSMLSYILTGGRRCSLKNALKLYEVSGVPVQHLFDRPKRDRQSKSEAAA